VQFRPDLLLQVPAQSIIKPAKGVNEQLVKALITAFDERPELRLTETGIDDTLLSFVRCSVAPEEHLLQIGWRPDWQPGAGEDMQLPLNTMARLADPIDFNTEAKVCLQ
jgi:hypothetical protein